MADGLLTTSPARSTATWRSPRATPGSTSSCPRASSGPGWPQSRRTTSGSPSSRSGWTPIAPATWTSRTAWVASRAAADGGREHDPGDEQRHLRRHLLGPPRVRHRRRRDRTSTRSPASGAPLRAHPRRLRGDRPGTPRPGGRDGVRGGSTGGRRSHLGGQRPAPRARAARLGATQLRSPLVRVRPARLDRLGHDFEVRGVRQEVAYFTSFYLYSLTRGIPQACVRERGRGSPASTTAGVGS